MAGEPLLEGDGSESDVLIAGACSFNSALINEADGLTLPFQGAVGLVLSPAVAAQYLLPIEVSVEFGSPVKMPVQHGQVQSSSFYGGMHQVTFLYLVLFFVAGFSMYCMELVVVFCIPVLR